MKVFAPVITHDVTLPNTAKKVPMVMVPVPDSRTLMAIPISTLSQLNETDEQIMESLKDEQQARELLIWNNGVGILDGCDLRFKINQLGCLELLDSDDEENQNQNNNNNNNTRNNRLVSNKLPKRPNTISEQQQLSTNSNQTIIKEISPGSSLLQGGPKTKRPKSSNSGNTNNNIICNNTIAPSTTTRSQLLQNKTTQLQNNQSQQQTNNQQYLEQHQQTNRDSPDVPGCNNNNTNNNNKSVLSEMPRLSEQNKKSLILDKLVPRQKLDEIKATNNVHDWTIEDVRDFIDGIPGCSGYGELFESQQICGKSLMYLKQKDLLDVINIKLGPAVKIYHAISLLKS